MANRSWFDILEDGLRAGRLPNQYQQRAVRELRDHAEEILRHCDRENLSHVDQEALLAQHLGGAWQVAATISDAYQRRFFPGRHPVVTFVLAPVPLGLVLWSMAVGILALPIWLVSAGGADICAHPLVRYVDLAFWVAFNIVPVTIALFFAWLARRSAVHPAALLCSTALLALFFASLQGKIQLPVGGPGTGMLFLGVSSDVYLIRALSMVVAVGVAVWAGHRYRERRAFA